MNLITSSQNPVIKEAKALKEKKSREEKRLFFIEGLRFVEEALKEDAEIKNVILSEKFLQIKGADLLLDKIEKAGLNTSYVTNKLFGEITDTENPQGVMAVVGMRDAGIEAVIKEKSFVLVLDSLQDPGNMGTIIRTADAAGVTGIILSKGCVDVYNPKVLRSTMGSIFHLPLYFADSLVEAISFLKSRGIRILASHLKGEANYFQLNLTDSLAVVVGNEAKGIGEETVQLADSLVKIPMPGRAESLNASVAAGLLLYEVVRQRVLA